MFELFLGEKGSRSLITVIDPPRVSSLVLFIRLEGDVAADHTLSLKGIRLLCVCV